MGLISKNALNPAARLPFLNGMKGNRMEVICMTPTSMEDHRGYCAYFTTIVQTEYSMWNSFNWVYSCSHKKLAMTPPCGYISRNSPSVIHMGDSIHHSNSEHENNIYMEVWLGVKCRFFILYIEPRSM